MECFGRGFRIIKPSGIAIQHPSDCEVKTWSYQVNLSGCPAGAEGHIYAYNMEEGGVSCSALFNITPLDSDTSR